MSHGKKIMEIQIFIVFLIRFWTCLGDRMPKHQTKILQVEFFLFKSAPIRASDILCLFVEEALKALINVKLLMLINVKL